MEREIGGTTRIEYFVSVGMAKELANKRHDNVMADVAQLNESYKKMGLLKIQETPYVSLHKKMEANNATMIEYFVSVGMAKELAMVENNEQGLKTAS